MNRHRSRAEHQVVKILSQKNFRKFMNMIFICLIIFIISIDDILTTNLSKNSSSNRIIILASCQADKTGLESSKKMFYSYLNKIIIKLCISVYIDV